MSSTYPHRATPALERLPTPCLILERDKLASNISRMAAVIAARGVRLRPHLKTAKCAEAAHLAAPGGSPITVSTLREAEYFAHHGWHDIFYAVGLGPGKLRRAAALLRSGTQLVTMVDSIAAAAALAEFSREEKLPFRALIEIDCGEHRGGLAPDSEDLLTVALALGPYFVGVATHGGQSYAALKPSGQALVAQAEVTAVRLAVAHLHTAGFLCEIVSIGSSPAALATVDLSGVTEFRAGVYMFWDLFQAGLGACAVSDIAISVLAEVIGRPADRPNEFLIDAGAFALSKDISTAALAPKKNAGYGWICDQNGHHLPGLRVTRVWQEHGLVVSDAALPVSAFPLGSRVRVLPNHACPTAAAHDRYFVVNGQQQVIAEWPRVNGW